MPKLNAPAASHRTSRTFDLQGHRGARGLWPENTIEGIERTLALGVTSIEIDTVLTRDRVAAVFHDLRLNPDLVREKAGRFLTKRGPAVAALNAADLCSYDIGRARPGSRLARRFPQQSTLEGARIPHLAEICARLCGTGVRLDVEIKSAPPGTQAAESILGQAPEQPGLALSFRSFDWTVLLRIRTLRPTAPLAWLTPLSQVGPAQVVSEIMKCGWPCWTPVWAPDHRTLRKCDITAAHAAGLRVVPYTVNSPSNMARLAAWGADGICTDRPDKARIVLEKLGIALPPPVHRVLSSESYSATLSASSSV